jgi:hypothetical protein
MKPEFYRQTFDSTGSCVLCRWNVLREGQTDMMKLTVTFPNFANAPKKLRPSGDNTGIEIHLFEGL